MPQADTGSGATATNITAAATSTAGATNQLTLADLQGAMAGIA